MHAYKQLSLTSAISKITGVGKSVLTRAIIRSLRSKYGDEAVAVTATTGIAATNIGGCTLHSWAGAGLAKQDIDKLQWMVRKGNPPAYKRWKGCHALIIDEGRAH